jgi:outer membrane lipoprotein-sorting protein
MTSGNNALPRVLVFLGLWLSVCACCAADVVTAPVWGLEQLMEGLQQVKSSKARFVERKHLAILNAPLEFTGTLLYTAPGRIEKHTATPRPESMLLDGDTLTVENRSRNQRRTLVLKDYPVIWAFVEGMRSTLAGDLPSLQRFYRVSLEGTASQWRLLLTPTETSMRAWVSEMRITGSQHRVRTIEVLEAQGDRSLMTISELNP